MDQPVQITEVTDLLKSYEHGSFWWKKSNEMTSFLIPFLVREFCFCRRVVAGLEIPVAVQSREAEGVRLG